jgi:hypothetical protein
MVNADIAANKTCLRKIKPLHWMKHSRFHTVLNNALQTVSETEQQAEEKEFKGKLENALHSCDEYNTAVINANITAAKAARESNLNETGLAVAASVARLTQTQQDAKAAEEKATTATEKAQAAKIACQDKQIQKAIEQAQSEHQNRIEEFKRSWQKGREFQPGLFARNNQNTHHPTNGSLAETHIAPLLG